MSVAKHDSGGVKHETLTITVNKDEKGYGMTVSGFNPVIIQSVSKNGAAWKAGVRYGDSLLRVNGASVKYSQHQDVVNMIKSSTTTVLSLQRQVSTSKVTAPLPVDREKQRQVEYTTASVLQKMFEQEVRHRDSLLNELDHGGSNSKKQELKATEIRIKNLQQQIERQNQNSCVITSKDLHLLSDTEPPATPPRQGILSNIPRSLSSLTGQSLRGNRHSLGPQPQVTCLDGAPPPLPPRTPNPLSPGGISPRGHSPGGMSPGGMSPGLSPNMPSFPSSRNIEPNSIDVQMNYPLAVTHPPIQSGGLGHQRSRSSPEQYLNNSIDKDWEMVVTPPGTPPPPYPVSQIAIDTRKDIISMEDDDNTNCIISSLYLSKDFTSIEDLNPARMAVFLNWVAGERRPPQAALLYLLTQAYCTGPLASLPRWAYELHSTFLVPGAPLKLSNIDENMAREIDDVLINEYDKEDALRKIFIKVREKAKEEVNQQIHEFQLKRQSGLGTFYGPTDTVLEECERDKQQEEAIILQWLMPRLDPWIKEASNDQWGATYGSSPAAVLAATIYPLLQYTFDLKPQTINSHLGLGSAGTPPRPTFLQRDKHYKQRIKIINKTTSHPLQVYGHSLNLATVSSYCLCIHCHLPIWGIAPQAYNCTVCKLRVHRHCAKQIEEPCCGPATPPFRISKIMEKLAPGTGSGPTTGNSHQHIDPNQHLHHHHHDKKQRKSTTSNFLHIERNSRKTEEDIQSALDNNNFSPHHYPGESKFNADDSGADSQHLPEPWNSVETSDKADSSHSVRQRPVTRAESYRDKGVKVQRTKRKTSDPNQLTSGQGFNDAEAAGNIGAPSGGSSSSSLSSKSNDGGAQFENNDSHSDWSEEEENTEPWSSKAPSDILLKMSPKARKRQDLIHELITTEASHVRSLRILRRIFYIPLGRSNFLTTHEFRALFPNLPDVLQRHRKLCSDLKTLASSNQVIQIRPLADTLIATLGDPKYPIALAKFCGGQRQALEALRIRLKRSKELLSLLNKKEQDPICGRLRLQDFLACVWQRLTKYQLLFEGILKNGLDEDEVDTEGGLAKIGHALELSKEILHTVDTAIKTMENEQRLKDIQSKLEIRGTNTTSEFTKSDPGELGRLNLTKHFLVMEGSLSIRQDSNKRLSVLALSLKECLVLLIKEGDKYILKPIPQSTHQPLSPVIDWKRVFFRTNAANKYGFFLVSIEGTQMYDLSAVSSSEYNTWTRHLNEAACAFGPRSATIEENPQTPNLQLTNTSVHPTNQDEASNVSESNTSIEEEKDDQPPLPTSPPPPPPPPPPPINEDDGKQVSGAIESVVGEPHDGDSSDNSNYIVEDLVTPSSVAVTTPLQTLTAHRQITPEERFRQAERKVMDALHEAAEVAKETINPGPNFYNAIETLAGKKDSQKYQWKTSLGNGLEGLHKNQEDDMSTTNLLLHAQYHVNNLTELLFKALRVSPSSCPMTKCSLHSNYGLCDMCFAKHSKYSTPLNADVKSANNGDVKLENIIDENNEEQPAYAINAILLQDIENSQPENKTDSIVMLEEFGESSTDPHDDAEENPVNSSPAGGLREILTTLLQTIPAVERERDLLKARLQQADQRIHRLHHLHRDCVHPEDESRLLNTEEVPNQNFCLNDQSGEG